MLLTSSIRGLQIHKQIYKFLSYPPPHLGEQATVDSGRQREFVLQVFTRAYQVIISDCLVLTGVQSEVKLMGITRRIAVSVAGKVSLFEDSSGLFC